MRSITYTSVKRPLLAADVVPKLSGAIAVQTSNCQDKGTIYTYVRHEAHVGDELATESPSQTLPEKGSAAEADEGDSESELPKRKPRGFWKDNDNVRREIQRFWSEVGVTSDKVPNQTLLHYFEVSSLRYAIWQRGGVTQTATLLGVAVIPGLWRRAKQTTEVRELLSNGHIAMDIEGPKKGATKLINKTRMKWRSYQELEAGRLKAKKSRAVRFSWADGNKLKMALIEFAQEHQVITKFNPE